MLLACMSIVVHVFGARDITLCEEPPYLATPVSWDFLTHSGILNSTRKDQDSVSFIRLRKHDTGHRSASNVGVGKF